MSIFDEVGLIGRDDELQRFRTLLGAFGNILISGQAGYGKTAFYHAILELMVRESRLYVYMVKGHPREVTKDLLQQLHRVLPEGLGFTEKMFDQLPLRTREIHSNLGFVAWRHLYPTISKQSLEIQVKEILLPSLEHNAKHIYPSKLVLVVDDLLRPIYQIDLIEKMSSYCQVIATVRKNDKLRKKIAPLLALFPRFSLLNVSPFDLASSKLLVDKWLNSGQHKSVLFSSPKVRDSFISHVAITSAGVPATLEHLLLTVEAMDVTITRDTIHRVVSDIQVKYVSMLPFFLLALLLLTVLRTVGRQIGNSEWVIIGAFAGIFLFLVLMFRSQLESEKVKEDE